MIKPWGRLSRRAKLREASRFYRAGAPLGYLDGIAAMMAVLAAKESAVVNGRPRHAS